MTFWQFMQILKARRRVALLVLGTVVVLVMGVCLFMTKQYTASATVVVDVRNDPLSTSAAAYEEATSAYLATQADIAASERVALRVVKALKLDEVAAFHERWQQSTDGRGDFDAWLADTLLKKVTVKPSPQSNVIDIAVRWPDAKAAATLANAFAQAYIDTNIALKVELAKQYATWFEERAKSLRADLESKQKALSDFESHTGIVATDERLDIENARLNELSSQLVSIQAQRQDSQSRQTQGDGNTDTMPEVLQNSLVVSLKADLSRQEARLKDLETSVGSNHPAYKAAQAEVESLRARLAQESSQIVASLGATTRINKGREGDILAALQAQKARILELKHQHDQAAVLQNDVATAQRNLDGVSQRLAQSSLEGATEQTNIAHLTPATEPPTYSSPKYLLVLVLSIVVGSFLGIAAAMARELSDRRIRSDEEVLQLLGVPIFGRIKPIAYEVSLPQRKSVFRQLRLKQLRLKQLRLKASAG
jgi:chain length determinant protein EpsF